jgi:hypothetical protein
MQTDAERIAHDLLAAYAIGREAVTEVFEANLAEQVEVLHSPGQPQDGFYDRASLVAAQATQADRLVSVLRDYRETVATSAMADAVTVRLVISGTLPGGTVVTINGTDVLTVAEGCIVRMVSAFASDQMAVLVGALMSG